MTNAQMAHKAGLDRVPCAGHHYERAIVAAGLTVTEFIPSTFAGGTDCYAAQVETKRGTLRILCGNNGTARIDKPNGTHKWVYEKTPAQIAALLKAIIGFYA